MAGWHLEPHFQNSRCKMLSTVPDTCAPKYQRNLGHLLSLPLSRFCTKPSCSWRSCSIKARWNSKRSLKSRKCHFQLACRCTSLCNICYVSGSMTHLTDECLLHTRFQPGESHRLPLGEQWCGMEARSCKNYFCHLTSRASSRVLYPKCFSTAA